MYIHKEVIVQVKHLIKHGNSKAIVIDKSILQAAGLDENCLFQIVVDSNTGITIQSVKPVNSTFKEVKNDVFKKYATLFKNLSDR
jgi:antitoxin component of MazEF toxin-antitoxin module